MRCGEGASDATSRFGHVGNVRHVGLSAGFPHHRLPQGKPGQELRLAPTAREACPKWNPS